MAGYGHNRYMWGKPEEIKVWLEEVNSSLRCISVVECFPSLCEALSSKEPGRSFGGSILSSPGFRGQGWNSWELCEVDGGGSEDGWAPSWAGLNLEMRIFCSVGYGT